MRRQIDDETKKMAAELEPKSQDGQPARSHAAAHGHGDARGPPAVPPHNPPRTTSRMRAENATPLKVRGTAPPRSADGAIAVPRAIRQHYSNNNNNNNLSR